jgi:hypothetical protein
MMFRDALALVVLPIVIETGCEPVKTAAGT